jgi:putative MATE family efflux protein
MRDMTKGSILGHLIHMAAFMSIGMILQTLYLVVDLYFVASLGKEAAAGLSLASNLMMTVLALTSMLGVGTTTLTAHAVGRGDHSEVKVIFNQAFMLSLLCGVIVLIVGYAIRWPYCQALSADAGVVEQGAAYLLWFVAVLALQFPLVAMSAALRGTGAVKPGMMAQIISVTINIILAPVLTVGLGTGFAMGVSGAALASFIGLIAGVTVMAIYVRTQGKLVRFDATMWKPQPAIWKRMLNIGLPAGGEFALISVYTAAVYWIIRDFGATAQAGFGIGGRVMQSVFLPVMAIAFAASPIAGQNFGARNGERVRETFRVTALVGSVLMLVTTLLFHISPGLFVQPFTKDPKVIEVATEYLTLVSWAFIASGLIFTASGMFQALGNTWPSLACSASRVVFFLFPALWMAARPGFTLRHLWLLSIASTIVQCVASLTLLQREFGRKLPAAAQQPAPV